jgi:hypothetical protein
MTRISHSFDYTKEWSTGYILAQRILEVKNPHRSVRAFLWSS